MDDPPKRLPPTDEPRRSLPPADEPRRDRPPDDRPEFVVCPNGRLELRHPEKSGRWIATADPAELLR